MNGDLVTLGRRRRDCSTRHARGRVRRHDRHPALPAHGPVRVRRARRRPGRRARGEADARRARSTPGSTSSTRASSACVGRGEPVSMPDLIGERPRPRRDRSGRSRSRTTGSTSASASSCARAREGVVSVIPARRPGPGHRRRRLHRQPPRRAAGRRGRATSARSACTTRAGRRAGSTRRPADVRAALDIRLGDIRDARLRRGARPRASRSCSTWRR